MTNAMTLSIPQRAVKSHGGEHLPLAPPKLSGSG